MNKLLKTSFIFFSLMASHSAYSDDELNSTYGKLLALSSTDDMSSSTLKNDEGLTYTKFSIPYSLEDLYVDGNYSFSLDFRLNYFTVEMDTPLMFENNALDLKWSIYNIVVAPRISYAFNENFLLEGKLEYGYSKMNNHSKFQGNEILHQEFIRKNLTDWSLSSVHITPHLGLNYFKKLENNNDLAFKSAIGYMILSNLNQNKNDPKISNRVGTWSLEGEYTLNDAFQLWGKNLDLSFSNQIGGFYGNQHKELGFGFINNTSVALKTPIRFLGQSRKLKTGLGYLAAEHTHGIMFILGLD
jgi:hypothetical protein